MAHSQKLTASERNATLTAAIKSHARFAERELQLHFLHIAADGHVDLIWASAAPAGVVDLKCDPLGEWAVLGFDSGDLLRLEWGV
jgi:hypothetical protein